MLTSTISLFSRKPAPVVPAPIDRQRLAKEAAALEREIAAVRARYTKSLEPLIVERVKARAAATAADAAVLTMQKEKERAIGGLTAGLEKLNQQLVAPVRARIVEAKTGMWRTYDQHRNVIGRSTEVAVRNLMTASGSSVRTKTNQVAIERLVAAMRVANTGFDRLETAAFADLEAEIDAILQPVEAAWQGIDVEAFTDDGPQAA